jgi:hypothetical protein
MAKRTTSKTREKLYATLALAFCVSLPWVLLSPSCQLDTSPRILPHPPVESDDSDSGESQ